MDHRIEELKRILAEASGGMTAEQLSWHPLPGKWCAAEVLEHLYLSYTGTINGFKKVLEAGKPLATPATLEHRLRTLVVVSIGYMPTGVKAPKVAEPRGVPPEKVRAEMESKIAAMDEIIALCEKKMGRKVKLLDHPILGPLNVEQWRKLHLVHARHHARQIRRLREQSTATPR